MIPQVCAQREFTLVGARDISEVGARAISQVSALSGTVTVTSYRSLKSHFYFELFPKVCD